MTGTVVGVRDGLLRVDVAPAGPCGPAVLEFAGGGRLAVDPVDPNRLLWVEVDDPSDALPLLQELLGVPTAQVLAGSDPVGVDVDVVPGPGASRWARWALASWYGFWTPLAVPRALALADVALAAADVGAGRAAFEAFDEAVPELLAVAGVAADRAVPPVLQERLLRALDVAGATLGPVHPAAAEVASARDMLAAMEPGPLPEATADVREFAGAKHLGGTAATTVDSGLVSSSVDWSLVPPRVLDTADGTVWSFAEDGGVRVQVKGHPLLDPASAAARWLLVRLVDPVDARPVVAVPLSWDPDAGLFVAAVPAGRLAGRDPAGLLVDVCRAETLETVRLGAAKHAEQGRRDSIRSLTQWRLSTAADAVGDPTRAGESRIHAARLAAAAADAFTWAHEEDEGGRYGALLTQAEAWTDRVSLAGPDDLGPAAGDGPGQLLLSELVVAWQATTGIGGDST